MMKFTKWLPWVFVVLLLVFIVVSDCDVFSNREKEKATEGTIPEWLLVEHRKPKNEIAVPLPVDQEPAQSTPSSPTPAVSQPAESVSSSTVQKWKQPGTMEFIVKMKLDEKVGQYKILMSTLSIKTYTDDEDGRNEKAKDDDDVTMHEEGIVAVAKKLGINLKDEYGITIPAIRVLKKGVWFDDTEGSWPW